MAEGVVTANHGEEEEARPASPRDGKFPSRKRGREGREREERMRGRERRREKEGEEDPSCDGKISVAREGSRGKGRRKTSREERRGKERRKKEKKERRDIGKKRG